MYTSVSKLVLVVSYVLYTSVSKLVLVLSYVHLCE